MTNKIYFDFPTKALYNILVQLRTGYCTLNEYKHKTGQTDEPNCICGAKETVHHYLLECPLTEEKRETMLNKLGKECGIRNINVSNILTHIQGEQQEHTKHKLSIVTEFIRSTGKFRRLIETTDGCD